MPVLGLQINFTFLAPWNHHYQHEIESKKTPKYLYVRKLMIGTYLYRATQKKREILKNPT
jgi:hypothetical protein